MAALGTPLFEAIPDDPEGRYSLTFLWRGDADTHSVTLSGFQWPPGGRKDGQLKHLDATDVWFSKPYEVRSGHRTTYRLVPNDPGHPDDPDQEDVEHHGLPDPLNRYPLVFPQEWAPFPLEESLPVLRKSFGPQWTMSVAVAPDAAAPRWTLTDPVVPTGRVEQRDFRSAVFGNERRIWIYVPPGYESMPKPAFMLLFDAWQYVPINRVPTVLDNLLAARKIPPTVVAFVDSLETARAVEMRSKLFPSFALDELMPWLAAHYRFDEDPSRRIVGGTSLGAMAAAFVAVSRPETFGNVLSQSGAFQNAGPGESEYEGLARAIARAPKLPIRFSLEVGLLEGMRKGAVAFADNWPDIVVANRHLRTVLQAKGYDFTYHEFAGAHDYGSWPATFPDRLVELIASRNQ
jgi:enterochelin esterase family protein